MNSPRTAPRSFPPRQIRQSSRCCSAPTSSVTESPQGSRTQDTAPSDSNALLEQLFREHAPRVFSMARRMLGDPIAAEQVTEEVLLKVARKVAAGHGDSPIRIDSDALVLETVRVCCSAPRASSSSEQFHRMSATATEDQASTLSSLIDGAIDMLPSCARAVYVLADVEGLPNARIAELLGTSVSEVRARLHQTRVQIRTTLALQLRS